VINGAEYEAIILGRLPESFLKKVEVASNTCKDRMNPSAKSPGRDQEIAALSNQCLNEYHPEDTDYGSVVVREKFCICFSNRVAKSNNNRPMSRSDATNYCSQRL
jgi:hypothetical protein